MDFIMRHIPINPANYDRIEAVLDAANIGRSGSTIHTYSAISAITDTADLMLKRKGVLSYNRRRVEVTYRPAVNTAPASACYATEITARRGSRCWYLISCSCELTFSPKPVKLHYKLPEAAIADILRDIEVENTVAIQAPDTISLLLGQGIIR